MSGRDAAGGSEEHSPGAGKVDEPAGVPHDDGEEAADDSDGEAGAETAAHSEPLPPARDFIELVERFGGERGDEPLYRLVLKLYDFAKSHPWPEHWLLHTAERFDLRETAELRRTEWADTIRLQAMLGLEGAERLLLQALELTRRPAGPAVYAETLEDDLAAVRGLTERLRAEPWEGWSGAFDAIAFGKLKSMRGDGFDKTLQEQAKELRDQAKSAVSGLKEELFGRTAEQFAFELRELAPLMRTLAQLVVAFGRRFEAAKREKGLLDFGDMEHYCLRILRDPASSPERTVPSAAALEYRRQFDEILLDEYQDTNMVQEAIVALLSRPGAGNRFMVGDVKQSIYRFRLAEPNLFLHKYETYSPAAEAETALFPEQNADAAESLPAEETADDSQRFVLVNENLALEAFEAEVDEERGMRIDLARNFRSRQEVVDGVNGVFRAIMRRQTAEMDYDERAELVCGASYPPAGEDGAPERYAVEFAVLDKGAAPPPDPGQSDDGAETPADGEEAAEAAEDLQAVRLEARYIAAQILRLRGAGGANKPLAVHDGRQGGKRPLAWRDIVILLRADKMWAPVMIEELRTHGIPAHAELSSGYFEATEVETVLSLLRVVDNPYQDIPLAGTLRSPIFGLTAEELALVRVAARNGYYFDAVKRAAGDAAVPDETRAKLWAFLSRLEAWRDEGRQSAVSELIWRIYRDTGYLDLVAGMPGGLQRQANLRALHDRARQYESSSLRGLFRFLRFIDRMRENGGDLGTAGALVEQEDVVRIMSIHKSKGLEFPVVFIAGLGKAFNRQDLSSPFLMHKQLGFGPRFVDTGMRVSYPTLPYLAIRERLRMESLAEEMRILYVALTRPKEKMFLVGTVADAERQAERWRAMVDGGGSLPDFRLAQAKRFLDWLAPLALSEGSSVTAEIGADSAEAGFWTAPADDDSRTGADETGMLQSDRMGIAENDSNSLTAEGEALSGTYAASAQSGFVHDDPGGAERTARPDRIEEGQTEPGVRELPLAAAERRNGGRQTAALRNWKTGVVAASLLVPQAAPAAETDESAEAAFRERLRAVRALVPLPASPALAAELEHRFGWQYPYAAATTVAAKTSVTEMKRLHAEADEEAAALPLPEGIAGTASEPSKDKPLAAEAVGDRAEQLAFDFGESESETDLPVPDWKVADAGSADAEPAAGERLAEAGGNAGPVLDEPSAADEHGTAAAGGFIRVPGAPADVGGASVNSAHPAFDAAVRGTFPAQGSGGAFTFRLRRPKFMEEASLTAAERGTVSHLVMQHIPLSLGEVDEESVRVTTRRLLERRMLTDRQAEAVDPAAIAAFFREPVGRRLLTADWVRRETPFSCTFPGERVYPGAGHGLGSEPVLIQGVIDCLFRDGKGLVLLDYKTDRIVMKRWSEAAERHRFQLTLYAEAVGRILGEPVGECYVFFFDGGRAVRLF
ncbi:UvrD-helicase domain-containing protein [Paenibacillus humicola]|uniref:UvrD-helicase domain-containing protein n=1 Tax=Paenibacillus humicola TaxID=3110540 RepID=UPI003B83338B